MQIVLPNLQLVKIENYEGASIDFGVFVCLNCSGAHRALGPSVTRVRSTKLDTWQSAWLELMQVGNTECNQYWENNIGLSRYELIYEENQHLVQHLMRLKDL